MSGKDDVRSDTVEAQYDQLERLLQFIDSHRIPEHEDPRLYADRLVIATQNTKLEVTAKDDTLEVREIAE